MYSKEKGFTHAPVEARAIHRPNRAPRVSIPPNYRGHAILDEERMRDGEERQSVDTATPVPRFEGLPRISQLGDGRSHSHPRYEAAVDEGVPPFFGADTPITEGGADGHAHSHSEGEYPVGREGERTLPSGFAPSRNAFGGGLSLGTEELLLLGLILLLLREGGDCADRGDLDETVILLGLLLLLG